MSRGHYRLASTPFHPSSSSPCVCDRCCAGTCRWMEQPYQDDYQTADDDSDEDDLVLDKSAISASGLV